MDLGTLSSHFRAHSEDPSEGYGLGLLPRQRACILDFFGPTLKQWITYSWVGLFVLFRVRRLCLTWRAGSAS